MKLIALDMDGTLLRADKSISRHTHDALRRAMDSGAYVALVSGRPQSGMTGAAGELGLMEHGGCIASLNGALVTECRSGKILHRRPVDLSAALQVCDFAEESGLVTLGYDETGVFTNDPNSVYSKIEARDNRIPLRAVSSMRSAGYHSLIYVLFGDERKLEAVAEKARRAFDGQLIIVRGAESFWYVMAPGVSKRAGAQAAADFFGVKSNDVLACGDGLNDIPMLRWAGMGVAMGNASDEVKRAARMITFDNERDGVAEAVKRFIQDAGAEDENADIISAP